MYAAAKTCVHPRISDDRLEKQLVGLELDDVLLAAGLVETIAR